MDHSIAQALRRRRGGGQRLPDSVADPMGQELRIDTSALRVHADPDAGLIARSVQSDAFTYGNDIYFAPGSYQPASGAGQRVLAHELSHVAAQRSGADGGSTGPLSIGRSADRAETVAELSANRVVGALRRSRNPEPVVAAAGRYLPIDPSVIQAVRRRRREEGERAEWAAASGEQVTLADIGAPVAGSASPEPAPSSVDGAAGAGVRASADLGVFRRHGPHPISGKVVRTGWLAPALRRSAGDDTDRAGLVIARAIRTDTDPPHSEEPVDRRGFVPVSPYLARPGPLRSGTESDGTDQAGAGPRARVSRVRVGLEPASSVRRQVAQGRYRLNTDGALRDDTKQYAVNAKLTSGTGVEVLDKGSRNSLFKAGWFLTNEHSWSKAPGLGAGWIDDSQLEFSLADQLEEAFARGAKPSIKQLQTIIQSATAKQRKQAAGDDAFLARAKAALDEDTYLGLLPTLGVHKQPTKPQLSQGGSAHTPGPDADKAIREHLQQYVAEAVKAGRKVEGEVSVVGDEDFQLAFDRQWVRAAGQTFPGKKAWEVCNAFVDVNLPKRHIWVHRDMGDTGVVIHEGMHKYADDTMRNEQIDLCKRLKIPYGGTSRLDEGTTEYFTRLVVGQLAMKQRVNYQNEFDVATKLAQRFGEKTLADAYYDGKFGALQKAVGGQWPAFAEAIEKKDWAWLKANNFS